MPCGRRRRRHAARKKGFRGRAPRRLRASSRGRAGRAGWSRSRPGLSAGAGHVLLPRRAAPAGAAARRGRWRTGRSRASCGIAPALRGRGGGSCAAISAAAARPPARGLATPRRSAAPGSDRQLLGHRRRAAPACPAAVPAPVRNSMPPRLSRPRPAERRIRGTALGGSRRMRPSSPESASRSSASASACGASRSRARSRRRRRPGRRRCGPRRNGFAQHRQRRCAPRPRRAGAGPCTAGPASSSAGRAASAAAGGMRRGAEPAAQDLRRPGIAGQHAGIGDRPPADDRAGPAGRRGAGAPAPPAPHWRRHRRPGPDCRPRPSPSRTAGTAPSGSSAVSRSRFSATASLAPARGASAAAPARRGAIRHDGGGMHHAADRRQRGPDPAQRLAQRRGIGRVAGMSVAVAPHAARSRIAASAPGVAAPRRDEQRQVPHALARQPARGGQAEALRAADHQDRAARRLLQPRRSRKGVAAGGGGRTTSLPIWPLAWSVRKAVSTSVAANIRWRAAAGSCRRRSRSAIERSSRAASAGRARGNSSTSTAK